MPGSASRCAWTATTTTTRSSGTTTPANSGGAPTAIDATSPSSPAAAACPRSGFPAATANPPVDPVRVAHGKVAEFQARGAVHFHALLRLDGNDPPTPTSCCPRPPPHRRRPGRRRPVRRPDHQLPHPGPPGPARGWTIAWGTQLDVRVITWPAPATSPTAVAGYLAKYATKATEVTGHTSRRITPDTIDLYADPDGTHTERLIDACWSLGADPATRLRRWAHMLGFGGHFLTKARRYSVTFRDLRQARITYRRGQDPGPEHGPIRTADHADDETILIVGTLTFAGTGWHTSGDALLANTAADQARKRRQAGRDELADEYNSTSPVGQAA